jgi:EF-P beta-lysylation protein EpmB
MSPQHQKSAWQNELINSVTSPELLLDLLELDKQKYLIPAQKACKHFGLRVTHSFVSRMEKKNPFDPLLLQVLPLEEELKKTKGYTADPLKEKTFNPLAGLLHKYESRVLINLISQCAINCRYCFRREFPYHENNPGKKGWNKIFDYIVQHPKINEVILSGADPLTAPDSHLEEFGKTLLEIKQIKTLRIHTRLPIVLPNRITDSLLKWLLRYPLKKVMVIHSNHQNEINDDVKQKLKLLKKADVLLLNHSVLLKNINDNSEVLMNLSRKLFSCGVLPYYLHLLDRVQGVSHFDVSIKTAKQIHKTLQEKLPGYLVPKLVREIAGEKHKTMI